MSEGMTSLAVRAPSTAAEITTLSGGNQQKVLMARNLLSKPRILLCDEPTQGVDVGTKVEMYKSLRGLADEGLAIVIRSTDVLELEGLCDRVLIMSRGSIVENLVGDEITEEKIVGGSVRSKQARADSEGTRRVSARGWISSLLRGDVVALPVLAAAIVALAIFTSAQNSDFLSSFNVESLLLLSTPLALVAFGQVIVLMTGGIDLSVGPLVGLGLVVLTKFATDGNGVGGFVLGVAALLGTGLVVGLANGSLVRFPEAPACGRDPRHLHRRPGPRIDRQPGA